MCNDSKNQTVVIGQPKWVGVLIALQILTLVGQWIATPGATVAHAQIPDAGAQQQKIIDQLSGTNDRLDQIISILTTGTLQVKQAKPDDNKGQ